MPAGRGASRGADSGRGGATGDLRRGRGRHRRRRQRHHRRLGRQQRARRQRGRARVRRARRAGQRQDAAARRAPARPARRRSAAARCTSQVKAAPVREPARHRGPSSGWSWPPAAGLASAGVVRKKWAFEDSNPRMTRGDDMKGRPLARSRSCGFLFGVLPRACSCSRSACWRPTASCWSCCRSSSWWWGSSWRPRRRSSATGCRRTAAPSAAAAARQLARVEAELVERRPARVARRLASASSSPPTIAGNALGRRARAVGPAQRRERQVQQRGVRDHRLEVHLVALDRVGLAVDRAATSKTSRTSTDEHAADGVEAAAALRRPRHLDGAPDGDGPVDRLERDVDHQRRRRRAPGPR